MLYYLLPSKTSHTHSSFCITHYPHRHCTDSFSCIACYPLGPSMYLSFVLPSQTLHGFFIRVTLSDPPWIFHSCYPLRSSMDFSFVLPSQILHGFFIRVTLSDPPWIYHLCYPFRPSMEFFICVTISDTHKHTYTHTHTPSTHSPPPHPPPHTRIQKYTCTHLIVPPWDSQYVASDGPGHVPHHITKLVEDSRRPLVARAIIRPDDHTTILETAHRVLEQQSDSIPKTKSILNDCFPINSTVFLLSNLFATQGFRLQNSALFFGPSFSVTELCFFFTLRIHNTFSELPCKNDDLTKMLPLFACPCIVALEASEGCWINFMSSLTKFHT